MHSETQAHGVHNYILNLPPEIGMCRGLETGELKGEVDLMGPRKRDHKMSYSASHG